MSLSLVMMLQKLAVRLNGSPGWGRAVEKGSSANESSLGLCAYKTEDK